MKTIKDCEWLVKIVFSKKAELYFCTMDTYTDMGIWQQRLTSPAIHTSIEGQKEHFEKFAKLNGITKYKYL